MSAPSYVIACDLGQAQDYTAIAVLEWERKETGRQETVQNIRKLFGGMPAWDEVNLDDEPDYYQVPQVALHVEVNHLQRLPLGTAYTALPDLVRTIADRLRQRWVKREWEHHHRSRYLWDTPITLAVDATGVGVAVVDLLIEAGLDPVAITITGGDTVVPVQTYRKYRVPKRDLAGITQAMLQTRRLQIADSLPDARVLKAELENFKAKISLTGHDSYEAGADWRSGNHDDIVLATAVGCWVAEHAVSDWSPQLAA